MSFSQSQSTPVLHESPGKGLEQEQEQEQKKAGDGNTCAQDNERQDQIQQEDVVGGRESEKHGQLRPAAAAAQKMQAEASDFDLLVQHLEAQAASLESRLGMQQVQLEAGEGKDDNVDSGDDKKIAAPDATAGDELHANAGDTQHDADPQQRGEGEVNEAPDFSIPTCTGPPVKVVYEVIHKPTRRRKKPAAEVAAFNAMFRS